MTTSESLLTAEEFANLPEPPSGERMELIRGRVVMAPPADTYHGMHAFEVGVALRGFVQAHRLGVLTGEGGYLLAEDPDVVRAPDVAWIAADRGRPVPGEYFRGAPNLAVEIVSPSDRDADVAEKVADWLAAGSQRVWVVRPRQRAVTVHRPNGDAHTYAYTETLDSDDAGFPVSGFELSLAAIFP
ncbi:MAG: Uma2 family endonuclease [Dehalococcoidia bacterium]|nr:Uma2 family endonuclease [Dehalococcoidia bacterium]